ncbi:hypothetical protein F5883DRAFT_256730 [Diaporthe sp. PMI_573]|nr:hypothetical protein F5883DRAFT_256730 [Diaporthaceae sp. PMI_573]
MSALSATYPSSNTTVSTGGVAALYHRCGGIDWTGPTECEAGSYCKEQNPFYFQCVAVEGTNTMATATGSNADYINTLLASGPASARPTTLVTITASSSGATPTATAEDDGDYCEEEQETVSSAAATPTATAEDDLDYCEEETASSAAATPTSTAEDGDDYCDEEETVTVTVSPRPTASAAAASEEGDDYCEE